MNIASSLGMTVSDSSGVNSILVFSAPIYDEKRQTNEKRLV